MSRQLARAIAWLFAIGVAQFFGCGPSHDKIIKDKERVAATPQAASLVIDASALAQIISAETSDPPKTHPFKDAIVRTSGIVEEIVIERSKNGAKALVRLQLSDKPQFKAKCFFSTTDEAVVQQLQVGEHVKLKGVCNRTYKDLVEITGCVLDSRE